MIHKSWHIVADENMPGLEAFASLGELKLLPGRAISREDLQQADVLLVRSVTCVDESLLGDSGVRFVGSATIGTDHLDLDWLRQANITVAHAPGCNAIAVTEYVLAAILYWLNKTGRVVAPGEPLSELLQGMDAAVVGVGNVGRRVMRLLSFLGARVLVVDPWQQDTVRYPEGDWTDLQTALQADLVSLHVPLVSEGPHPTYHLLSAERLAGMRSGTLLINTCRGAVVDNRALESYTGHLDVVLDVWEQEPAVPFSLFSKVMLGTPHIAGYSYEGKLRGSLALYQALLEWGQDGESCPPPGRTQAGDWPVPPSLQAGSAGPLGSKGQTLEQWFSKVYSIERDHHSLQALFAQASGQAALPEEFDRLRKHYPLRRELGSFQVDSSDTGVASLQKLLV